MSATCYGVSVTTKKRRPVTDREVNLLQLAAARREQALGEERDSLEARNALWRDLYEQGASPTSIANAYGCHRTEVQRVCTPGRMYGAKSST
jgi:DNA invertase Pin-like site-specific DNA recombinase